MDLFTGYDWTQCQLLNVIPVNAEASDHWMYHMGDTSFSQIGVKFHGHTDIRYDHQDLLFDSGSILYLPQATRPDIPYHKHIVADGEGACIFFTSRVPLPPYPVLFPGTTDTPMPELALFRRLVHVWRQENSDLAAYGIFYQLLAELKRRTFTEADKSSPRYRLRPAADWLHTHICEPYPDLDKLASLCGLSKEYFRQCFRDTYGMSPLQYLHREKLQYACALLTDSRLPVTEIAGLCGFDCPILPQAHGHDTHRLPPALPPGDVNFFQNIRHGS